MKMEGKFRLMQIVGVPNGTIRVRELIRAKDRESIERLAHSVKLDDVRGATVFIDSVELPVWDKGDTFADVWTGMDYRWVRMNWQKSRQDGR